MTDDIFSNIMNEVTKENKDEFEVIDMSKGGEKKMSGSLKDWIKENQSWLRLKGGGEFTGKFIGVELDIPGYKGSLTNRYKFEVDGKEKLFDSASKRLAWAMAEIKEGETVKISAIGESTGRLYKVEVV